MKLVILSSLFNIRYGHSLELNRLKLLSKDLGGVPFVSRKMGDNGISAYVAPISGIEPAKQGELSCALSGNGVLSTFLQDHPFYTGFHVAILEPKIQMTKNQLLFYSLCIKSNKYRYSYGRQANRTLGNLLVPSIEELPSYVKTANTNMYTGCDLPQSTKKMTLNSKSWGKFRYDEIFEIKKGYYNKKPPMSSNGDLIPFIGATDRRNGITGYATYEDICRYSRDGSILPDEPIEKKIFEGGCITVSNNGSVGEAFYQPTPFTCSHDVNPLYLLDNKVFLTPQIGAFLSTIIKLEKYRWSYGRKWRPIRMPNSLIYLPIKSDGSPDWEYMEEYIKSLPYSSQI